MSLRAIEELQTTGFDPLAGFKSHQPSNIHFKTITGVFANHPTVENPVEHFDLKNIISAVTGSVFEGSRGSLTYAELNPIATNPYRRDFKFPVAADIPADDLRLMGAVEAEWRGQAEFAKLEIELMILNRIRQRHLEAFERYITDDQVFEPTMALAYYELYGAYRSAPDHARWQALKNLLFILGPGISGPFCIRALHSIGYDSLRNPILCDLQEATTDFAMAPYDLSIVGIVNKGTIGVVGQPVGRPEPLVQFVEA